ncbi:MAG: tRNA pseudouridine(55) synthase TruB [Actinobacteria bacterium]|nr:tRNA pseudouridine(55) synthase TruB [Actinomycetota bacterium]
MKRGESGICALIAVDKPYGLSSHDVDNRIRRIYGEKRVGHAGTLDPAATGLLLVGIGPATRLVPYLTGHSKSYVARITFGMATDTDDATGTPCATGAVPPEISDPAFAARFIESLQGEHEQMPPAFSAIKKDGKKAYDIARDGGVPDLDARHISILDARLIAVDCDDEGTVSWEAEFFVSKGTYIRAIARDIGTSLGTCAHLSALRRTSIGNVGLSLAYAIEEFEADDIEAQCINPVTALGFPVVEIERDDILSLVQGKHISVHRPLEDGLVCVVCEDRLLSIHEADKGVLRAKTVIPGGVLGARK